mmetsp:Transcript_5261/g.9453  ORF Transcript_5261/g.9453 Transcript_5261/m.9453 type:complete len:207 (+) Transcript_5261:1546-2166(+)
MMDKQAQFHSVCMRTHTCTRTHTHHALHARTFTCSCTYMNWEATEVGFINEGGQGSTGHIAWLGVNPSQMLYICAAGTRSTFILQRYLPLQLLSPSKAAPLQSARLLPQHHPKLLAFQPPSRRPTGLPLPAHPLVPPPSLRPSQPRDLRPQQHQHSRVPVPQRRLRRAFLLQQLQSRTLPWAPEAREWGPAPQSPWNRLSGNASWC